MLPPETPVALPDIDVYVLLDEPELPPIEPLALEDDYELIIIYT